MTTEKNLRDQLQALTADRDLHRQLAHEFGVRLENAEAEADALRERAEKAERDRDRWRQAADALGVAPE